jgi:hypothetical protein
VLLLPELQHAEPCGCRLVTVLETGEAAHAVGQVDAAPQHSAAAPPAGAAEAGGVLSRAAGLMQLQGKPGHSQGLHGQVHRARLV